MRRLPRSHLSLLRAGHCWLPLLAESCCTALDRGMALRVFVLLWIFLSHGAKGQPSSLEGPVDAGSSSSNISRAVTTQTTRGRPVASTPEMISLHPSTPGNLSVTSTSASTSGNLSVTTTSTSTSGNRSVTSTSASTSGNLSVMSTSASTPGNTSVTFAPALTQGRGSGTSGPVATPTVREASPHTSNAKIPGNSRSEATTSMGSLSPRSTSAAGVAKPTLNRATSAGGDLTGISGLTTFPTMFGSETPRGQDSTSAVKEPSSSLSMLAFGVMSFILILIIVMVVLVTAVNLRGRCRGSRDEGKKSGDSVVSESNITVNGEKESITLVSMKTINTETDTDSPRISSIHSTALENGPDGEPGSDLHNSKMV
ncbi:endothelial cell-specific chemotaxis regulator [Lepisosteus oculatus]|uniref:endothelial cell-specific chemotaxis regulator n=1 Tax=Lepisosteus oculatus TaxID=7918 RepID=UPI0035F52B31